MQKQNPQNEYLLVFTSFYKSMYAKDLLRSMGISAVPGRAPAGVFKTCSQGLYVKCSDVDGLLKILGRSDASPKVVYKIEYRDEKREYVRY